MPYIASSMTTERLYDGRKIKARLRKVGKRPEGLADYLDMCGKNAAAFVRTGKLPKRHTEDADARADTEAKLVEFLGIESINEILRTPEADRAA
jgi:hypothetical protein